MEKVADRAGRGQLFHWTIQINSVNFLELMPRSGSSNPSWTRRIRRTHSFSFKQSHWRNGPLRNQVELGITLRKTPTKRSSGSTLLGKVRSVIHQPDERSRLGRQPLDIGGGKKKITLTTHSVAHEVSIQCLWWLELCSVAVCGRQLQAFYQVLLGFTANWRRLLRSADHVGPIEALIINDQSSSETVVIRGRRATDRCGLSD